VRAAPTNNNIAAMTIESEHEAPAPVSAADTAARPQQDRRRFPRKLLRRSAKVVLPDHGAVRARTIELSRRGSVDGQLAAVTVTARLASCVPAGKDGFRVGFEVTSADPASTNAMEAFMASGESASSVG
jgi:hypothetical protein